MSQMHPHSENAQKARNGMNTKQQVKEEDRAAWEGMTDMPPQESHTSKRRRMFNHMRRLATRGLDSLRRAFKARSQ